MTIKEFIEKAIEGGLKSELAYDVLADMERGIFARHHAYCVFALDPLAWQAVGKVEGWGTEMTMIDEVGHPKEWCFYEHCDRCGETILDQEDGCPKGCDSDNAYIPEWQYNMHRMIDHIADGGTITSYLKDL